MLHRMNKALRNSQRSGDSVKNTGTGRTAEEKVGAKNLSTPAPKSDGGSPDNFNGGSDSPKAKKENGLRRGEVLAGFVMIVLIFAIAVGNLLLPDREFSEKENRVLAQKPELSVTSLMDGRFMSHSESYLSDQFMFRDVWISIRSRFRLMMGSSDSNGIYRGERGYLFQAPSEPDEEHLTANVEAINRLAENTDLRIFMMVVPTAANILSDYLPAFTPTSHQDADLKELEERISDNINYIDTRDALEEHKSEYIYYYTDHHWTTKGAYYAFLKAAPQLGLDKADTVEYARYAVTDSFAGTLASKSGFPLKQKDTIEVWIPSEDAAAAGNSKGDSKAEKTEQNSGDSGTEYQPSVRYIVDYVEEERKSADLYDTDKLEGSDQYAVFFGGNYPLIKITTTNDTGRSPLLIFKDSYANCFVPFLLPYYDEIIMVDPRYYYGDLGELIRTEKISQILFLYNADTFFEDTSLADVLTGAIDDQAEAGAENSQ